MSKLIVYLHEDEVGQLEQDDSGLLRFTYAATWLAKEAAIPISRMLPLTSETFESKKARPFFAGILPRRGPGPV